MIDAWIERLQQAYNTPEILQSTADKSIIAFSAILVALMVGAIILLAIWVKGLYRQHIQKRHTFRNGSWR